MIDWKSPDRKDTFHFLLVDPHNLDIVRGEIKNVILDDTSITMGYDTDTRVSGSIGVPSSENIMSSWVRIIHEVEVESYRKELGTFVPVNPSVSKKSGLESASYDLQSTLWTMQNNLCPYHFSIGAGAYSSDVFARICDTCEREYLILSDANNYRYTSSLIYEMGSSYLDDLYDTCSISRNRANVDGHGRILLSKYVNPAYITPSWSLDYDDARSMIIGGIEISNTDYDMPNRVIVIYNNDDKEIYAYADASEKYSFSHAKRGYVMAETHNVSDLSPATQANAQTLANQYLEESISGVTEYKFTSLYFPCNIGETLMLTFNQKAHHCLIKSIDPINLGNMTMGLTLREV